jgi:hypothetical protein
VSANSKNSSETNANQGALATQQQQTQAQIIAAERANDNTIARDLGTGAGVPHPPEIPSVAAVMGPGEASVLNSLSTNGVASSESEAAAAVDPNETGLLRTFYASAHGAEGNLQDETLAMASSYGTQASSAEQLLASSSAASQAGASASAAAAQGANATAGNGDQLPLGPQYSSEPVYSDAGDSSSTTPASSGPSPLLLGLLVVGGAGGLYVFRKKL